MNAEICVLGHVGARLAAFRRQWAVSELVPVQVGRRLPRPRGVGGLGGRPRGSVVKAVNAAGLTSLLRVGVAGNSWPCGSGHGCPVKYQVRWSQDLGPGSVTRRKLGVEGGWFCKVLGVRRRQTISEGYLWFRGRGDRHVNQGRPAHREAVLQVACLWVEVESRCVGSRGQCGRAAGVAVVGSEVSVCIYFPNCCSSQVPCLCSL